MRTTDRNGLKMPDGDDIDFPGAMEDNTEIIDDAISKCNFYASSDPLVTDDSTKGYSVGSIWVNGTSKIFQCVSPTANNAIWKQIFPSLGWIPAGETWTYSGADDPTFTFTIPGDKTTKYYAGMKIKLTQTTVKYFIITKVAYSDPNTTVTVYGGTDYDLANAAITDPYYSMIRGPAGFPMDPAKWTVKLVDNSLKDQANPTSSAWYNVGGLSLTIPIGVWRVYYFSASRVGPFDSACQIALITTLSTANNSESDEEFTVMGYINPATAIAMPATKEKVLNLASKTTYYLNLKYSSDSVPGHLYINGDFGTTIIFAVCAYL